MPNKINGKFCEECKITHRYYFQVNAKTDILGYKNEQRRKMALERLEGWIKKLAPIRSNAYFDTLCNPQFFTYQNCKGLVYEILWNGKYYKCKGKIIKEYN